MTNPEFRLSVSKFKTFTSCKKQYEFNYILKLPKEDKPYHTLGKFLHLVLETFHNYYVIDNSDVPLNVAMGNAWKAAIKQYGLKMPDEMRKEARSMIDKYLQIVSYEKNNDLSSNILACEKQFSFSIENKVTLNGVIDRIQLDKDNIIHIADYKSTKNKKYLKDDWFQLLTYCYYMLMHECSDATKIRASYIMLRHDFEYITKEFNRDEILSIKDKYLEYTDKILSETEFTPTTSILCNYCDFLQSCDAGKKFTHKEHGEVEW